MNAIIPYIIPFYELIKSGCKVTERKAEFPLGSRNMAFISLVYMVFTYGVLMPSLFLFAVISITFQHIVDKILLTYYFLPKPSNDIEMSWRLIKSIKYSAFPFTFLGTYALYVKNCSSFGYNDIIGGGTCYQKNLEEV